MQQALKEAQKAYEGGEVPVGAVVVLNERVIARGYNQVELLKDSSAHAEMIALTSAFNESGSKYLPEATIYITLEPCLMCAGALYWSKIGRIVYGAHDEKHGYQSCIGDGQISPVSDARIFHPKTQLVHGILADECAGLMRAFFKERRNQNNKN